MKRTLALVLALIMILCMIPASMLTAFARGRGVYANSIENQTIENAPGQYIPETVVVDGVLDDTGWREDDWKRVNSESGTWNVQFPTKNETINNETFSYKYNVRKDYYYLYGAFSVPTDRAGLVKLWLNNDSVGQNRYSHLFTFDITGKMSGGVASYQGFGAHPGTWSRVTATGSVVKDTSTYEFEKSKVVFTEDTEKGLTNIEFKVLLADFCPEKNPVIDYFVSVDTEVALSDNDYFDYEALYHPAIEVNEVDANGNYLYNRADWFPSMNSATWKSEFAGVISTDDLSGIGDHSFKSGMEINGEFDEAEWAQHTDFYSRWYERTNVVDYKDNTNFMKPYADLSLNKTWYNATYNSAAEHDLRLSAAYIHGAALVYNEADTSTIIRFNMYDIFDGGYNQVCVYLSGDASTLSAYSATWYAGGSDSGSDPWDITSYMTGDLGGAGTVTVNSDSNLYSFEFKLSRSFGPDFTPDVYDFCIAAGGNGREWSCASGYDGNTSGGYEQHPPYQTTEEGRKQDYFPVHHFSNEAGLKEIGAPEGTKIEFYEPYTLYTTDGYLGVKAWPGLTFSAGGPVNASYVTPDLSDRIEGLHYLHSLRADYEFLYGAVHIQADADSNFTEWKHGTKDHPAGGDLFSLWVSNPEYTAGASILRYDLWTYVENGEVKARIGGYSGRTESYYTFRADMDVAFVNRENDANKTRVYAFEYKIPLQSVNTKLNIEIDVSTQEADYLSTPILEYYTSLSVANKNNVIGDKENCQYAGIVWPRTNSTYTDTATGTTTHLYPDGWATPLTTTTLGNWTAAYAWSEDPQVLRYQDVIRVVEPDGRIVEELRFDLDDINFSDSEYRDISKYGNFFTAKEEFYVGRDYAYLGAQIDGEISAFNTKVILWIKTKDGNIHNYEFGHNGASVTMKFDGTAVDFLNDATYNDQMGMTTTNGLTYFEAVIDMDRFGADQGFEYFIEIQQRVNGENLSRIFSDGEKKIILPSFDQSSQIDTVSAWYLNSEIVQDLIHFPREEITIDGNLNDNGWDNGEWIYVSPDINANLQEADIHKDTFQTDFYYQLRVDDEYLYVAAVIFYSDAHSDSNSDGKYDDTDALISANKANILAREPGFRIWLKSGENGESAKNGGSETYTDYYGMRLKADGSLEFGSYKNTMPTYANNTRNLYNKNYVHVTPKKDANGNYVVGSNGIVEYTYDEKGMSVFNDRTKDKNTYPTELFGYTKYIINEEEANKNADETVVLKGETVNPEDYESLGMLKDKVPGVEQGVMRFGHELEYNKFDHGRVETLGEDSTVVEFRVKLDEFGGHDQFQYMVTTSTETLWEGGTRTTMYPAITSEAGSRDNYFHYYYPYWHWVDGTSATVTEEVRADMTLLTYKRPVITLGAKVSKTYMYQGKETNALRFGGLWEEKYIRKTKELAATNGYWPDKEGNPNWVDYWDVKAMGMVVIPTYLLQPNKNITADRPGKYDLFRGTAKSAWMDADGIVSWAGRKADVEDGNDYADYKNFAFYVTVVNAPVDANFCFRGFVDYYDEVLNKCPSYYDVILERSIDMVVDHATNTYPNTSEEEDGALKPGDFSRPDESTWTDGSDMENSRDYSDIPSEDVSEDVSEPGISTEQNGASLDIAWPNGMNSTSSGYTNSLVFADNTGAGFTVGGFYYDETIGRFPDTQLADWRKLYFTENADGTLTLVTVEDVGGTDYASWIVGTNVMIVAYHPTQHPNADVFNDFFENYQTNNIFVLEGMSFYDIGGTSANTEINTTLKRVIACDHNGLWIPADCDTPKTCSKCGATEGAPLGHTYDPNDTQTCLTGINCTVCGYEKNPPLGHTTTIGWQVNETHHWWTCNRVGCDGTPGEILNKAAHSFRNGKCTCGYACAHTTQPGASVIFHPAVEPTCGVAGNVAYYECSCGLKFSDADCKNPISNVVLPALEHDYDEETGICNNCGDELTPTAVAPIEHAFPGGYYSDGNGGWYSMVFADSTETPHELAGFAEITIGGGTGSSVGSNYFPVYNSTTLENSDLAWWRKVSFKKFGTVDGIEYFVVEAVCEPATRDENGNLIFDDSYLTNTTRDDSNPWYVDGDTMVIAMPSHHAYEEAFAALQVGDMVYLSGENGYSYYEIGQADEDVLLTDRPTELILHRHKWQAATCTEPKTCRECGAQEAAGDLGHTPGAEATCTTSQVCTTCNAVLNPALGHQVGEYTDEVPATCETAGTKAYAVCGRCSCNVGTDGKEITDLVIPALGHITVKVGAVDATCTDAGNIEYYTCNGCDKWFSDAAATTEITDKNSVVIDALGHALETTLSKDETGHWYACSRCDVKDSFAEHIYPENSDKCDVCGYLKDHVHVKGEEHFAAIAPDCDTDGQLEYWLCAGNDCDAMLDADGNVLDSVVDPALGHAWVDADCDTPKTCSRCGETEGEALGHTAGAAATCTEDQVCTVCGKVLVEAFGHTAGAAATCTTAQTCTVCGTELAPALGHTAGAAATCTTAQTCTVCGTELAPALGHVWVDADCDTPKTCSRCGETEGEALGHNYSDEWTTDKTHHWHECSRCDVKGSYGEHTYVDGICSACEKVSFTPIKLDYGYPKTDAPYGSYVFAYDGGSHTLRGFETNYPVVGSLDGFLLIALDMTDDDGITWRVAVIDPTGKEYYEDIASGGSGNPTATEWNVGDGMGVDGANRVVIAIPQGHASYDDAYSLKVGDELEWVGDKGFLTVGNSDENNEALGETYLRLLCAHAWVDADCDTPKTCSKCGATEGEALGHTPGAAATCTTAQTCTVCGAEIVSALGHTMSPATCTEASKCIRCDYTEGEALGHTPGAAATCTAAQTCTVCGIELAPILAHTPGAAATCATAQTCTVCGTVLAPALDHTPGAAATCTTAQTCTVCGAEIASALGHTPGAAATCTTAQTCTVCGGVVVEALGHTEGPDATCTTDKICTVCGEVLVAAFGHTWYEAPDGTKTCTVCGFVESPFVEVTIAPNYVNITESTYNGGAYNGGMFIYASNEYAAISGHSYLGWCDQVLLEYDDVIGLFRVVDVSFPSDVAATGYNNWHTGFGRIVVASWYGNTRTLTELKIDDYLELSGTTLDALAASGTGGLSNVTLTTVNHKGTGDATAPQVLTPIIVEPEYNDFTVAYVPLDDRPVHTDRVKLTAEEAGITLLMPNAADYQTHLYNASLGEEGHGGNTANILAWLKQQEANGIDYYVIALDQVFSGGLVNSRYSDPDFDGQLTEADLEAANFLVELAKNNYVVYTDTIMRLASTYPYKTHTQELYTAFRNYGEGKNIYGSSNRIILSEDGEGKYKLSLEHVISSYAFGSDGAWPIGRVFSVNGSNYTLSNDYWQGYLGARERKLRITDYMLRNAGGNINHYYIGMDDSAEGETIQKNEQRYIDMIIEQTGANAITFAGADEMSVMGISAMTNLLVKETPVEQQIPAADGWEISKVPVNVVYFSEEAKNWQADEYDSGKLGPAIDLHLKALDAYQVADAYKLDKRVIQLVVVARGTEQYSFGSDGANAQQQIKLSEQNAANAAVYIEQQLDADRPVAIIDVSYWNASHLNFVVDAMYFEGIFDRDDFNEILGYSTWNTAGNAIGLGMGQAFARYNYIMNTDTVSKSSNLGFLKLLAYSFVKDSAYRTNASIGWTMETSSAKTYTCGTYSYTTGGFTGNEFLGYINNSNKMLLAGGKSTTYYAHNISIHTPIWPANWGPRSFECWFTVEGTSEEPETIKDAVAGGGIALPDEELG